MTDTATTQPTTTGPPNPEPAAGATAPVTAGGGASANGGDALDKGVSSISGKLGHKTVLLTIC